MQLTFRHELAFVTSTLTYSGVSIESANVLVDAGAASTIIAIGVHGLDNFELEIGEMDYGFLFGGILGMDFLRAAGARIDLDQLTIEFA